MATKTSNWTQFKWPFAPLSTFTRSEPFPSSEMKNTYVGGTHRPGARARKHGFAALKKRWGAAR